MPKEFLMRGKTVSSGQEKLEFGHQARPGYGYRMTEFALWPSDNLGTTAVELFAAVTSDNSAEDPINPNFNNDGLIAVAKFLFSGNNPVAESIINDLFVITQDLILSCRDTGGSATPVNWQCRFEEIKLSAAAESVANYNQFSIYNTSQ